MNETDQSAPRLNAVWGWTGLDAVEILGFGNFGDVLAVARDGSAWAVSPADTSAFRITDDSAQIAVLRRLENPKSDLFADGLSEALVGSLGHLGPGDVYALQYPVSVGGTVEADKFRIESFWDYHIRMSELGLKLREAGPGGMMLVAQDHDGKPLLEPIAGSGGRQGGQSGPGTPNPAQGTRAAQPQKKRSLLSKVWGVLRSVDGKGTRSDR